jgi:hypothetical protein
VQSEPDSAANADTTEPAGKSSIELGLDSLAEKYGADAVTTGIALLVRGRRPRATVAFNSLLVAAVGEFEALCSNCIQSFVSRYPGKLTSSDRTFTFAEISEFGDLESFRTRVTDLYAENIMRGSVDDWLKWFATNLKLSEADIAEDWDVLSEIFQRRNVLVHNGGVVNHLYRAKVKKMPRDVARRRAAGIEARADVGKQYLQDSIAQLNAAGLVLAVRTALKLKAPKPGQHHAAMTLISDASYEFLRDNRDRELVIFSERILPHCTEEATRLLVQVNLWCARKRDGGAEAVASEVHQWDVRHCSQRFQIAKLTLLDQHEQAWEMAQHLMETGELHESEWKQWPLFADSRAWLESQSASLATDGSSPLAAAEGDGNDGSPVEDL